MWVCATYGCVLWLLCSCAEALVFIVQPTDEVTVAINILVYLPTLRVYVHQDPPLVLSALAETLLCFNVVTIVMRLASSADNRHNGASITCD